MNVREYNKPSGINGIGSDIGWCSRQKGRKRCNLCFKYEKQDIWSKNWHWFYLISWYDMWFQQFAHFRFYKKPYEQYAHLPVNYRNIGLKDFELKKLLKKGCKDNKKCRCMSVAQRAFWYCSGCYNIINHISKIQNSYPHDVMLECAIDRNELKTKILILRLSGSL